MKTFGFKFGMLGGVYYHPPVPVTPETFPMVTDGLIHRVESSDFDATAHATSVSTWYDKVTPAHDWTAQVGITTPYVDQQVTLNGHATLNFTSSKGLGATCWFPVSGYTGLEMFCVWKRNIPGPYEYNLGGPGVEFVRGTPSQYLNHQPWVDGNIYESFGCTVRQGTGNPSTATGQATGRWGKQFTVYNARCTSGGVFTTAMNTSSVMRPYFTTSGLTFTTQGGEKTLDNLYTIGYGRNTDSGLYYFNGWIAAIYVYSKVLTDVERQQMMYYLDYKWDITVQGLADRVAADGSVVAEATKRNLRTFWLGVNAANLTPKLRSVNAFVGDSLHGATTPLTPVWSLDPYTLISFTAADVDAEGLAGNASNKSLNTGMYPSTFVTNTNVGISLYATTVNNAGRYDSGYTSNDATQQLNLSYCDTGDSNKARFVSWAAGAASGEVSVATPGFGYLSGNRIGANDARLFFANGTTAHTQLATNTNATAGTPMNAYVNLFCTNAYQGPTPFGHVSQRYGFFALHEGLTEAESAALSALVLRYRYDMALSVPVTKVLQVNVAGTLYANTKVAGHSATGYQWYENGSPISNGGIYAGATTESLVLTPTSTGTNSYACLVSAAGLQVAGPASTVIASSQAVYFRGDSLAGWGNNSCTISTTVGKPPPSFRVPGSGVLNRDFGSSLAGKTITLLMRVNNDGNGLCNFFFMCNSSGAGNMLRLESRFANGSGIAVTSSWTSWSGPTPTIPRPFGDVFHEIKIVINAAGNAVSWYWNGLLQQTGVAVTNSGNWIGCVGDGLTGGYYQDITIT